MTPFPIWRRVICLTCVVVIAYVSIATSLRITLTKPDEFKHWSDWGIVVGATAMFLFGCVFMYAIAFNSERAIRLLNKLLLRWIFIALLPFGWFRSVVSNGVLKGTAWFAAPFLIVALLFTAKGKAQGLLLRRRPPPGGLF